MPVGCWLGNSLNLREAGAFPAPLFLALQLLEGNWGKEQAETHRPPPVCLPPQAKGIPGCHGPPPRSAPHFALRLCFFVMFVLPTYGPGWKSNHAGGQMNLRGGDKAIITGNVSNPRPVQHWFSREKVYSACGAKLGKEWKRLHSPHSARLHSCQHSPLPTHSKTCMHRRTYSCSQSAEISL